MPFKKIKTTKRVGLNGFTLLEMIVSLGIFSIIAVIAVGSLVRITSLNRQARYLQLAMNDINYALESMSREMRMGTNFHCGNDEEVFNDLVNSTKQGCDLKKSDSGQPNSSGEFGVTNTIAIAFKTSKLGHYSGDLTKTCRLSNVYWITKIGNSEKITIKKAQQEYCDDRINIDSDSTNAEASTLQLIDSNNVIITDFKVTNSSDDYSLLTVALKGYVGIKENEKNYFDIHTAISQRIRD